MLSKRFLCLTLLTTFMFIRTDTIRICFIDEHCLDKEFCLVQQGKYGGVCHSCWRCCLDTFGAETVKDKYACMERCMCTQANLEYCASEYNCPQGYFCNTNLLKCRPCYECIDSRICGECPYGPVSQTDSLRNHKTFLSFYTLLINKNESQNVLSRHQVLNWLTMNGWTEETSESVYVRLFGSANIISRRTFADTFAGKHSKNGLLCQKSASESNANPGCQCTFNQCPKGHACVQLVNNSFDIDAFFEPSLSVTNRYCIECPEGHYCPNGTFAYNISHLLHTTLCPSGYYCPTPSEKYACPPGSFCSSSKPRPQSCNFTILIMNQLYLYTEPETVASRLFNYLDPFVGNYCPSMSSSPSTRCPSGYYCPNTSMQLPCPKGHFCKAQSTYPRKCPSLTICNPKSTYPEFSYFSVIFPLCILVFIFAVKCWKNVINTLKKRKTIVLRELHNIAPLPYLKPIEHIDDIILEILNNSGYNSIKTRMSRFTPISSKVMSLKSLILPIKFLRLLNIGASAKKDSKPWLWPNSVTFLPCRMNCIMGGSGCGKSTMLDLLRGKVGKGYITGEIDIKTNNNVVIQLDLKSMEKAKGWTSIGKLKTLRGYVPQDDIVFPDLTVKENLIYSTMMRFESKKHELDDIVSITLELLKLQDIQDMIVGNVEKRGISGGQRKRVNIGMEIVCLPSLLLMDEPTSGLDSNGTKVFLEYCQILTDIGITIISVVHQPRYSCFMMFDHVLFLSKYGTVFEGSPTMSLMYFSKALDYHINPNENPADAIMDIIGTPITSQQIKLVNYWRSGKISGMTWTRQCTNTYPLLNYMPDASVVFDQTSRYIFDCLLTSTTSTNVVTKYELKQLFDILYIKCDIQDIADIILYINSRYNTINNNAFTLSDNNTTCAVSVSNLIACIDEMCSKAAIANTYSNVIDKIGLFDLTPGSLNKTSWKNQNKIIAVLIALKFIQMLKKRQSIKTNMVDASDTSITKKPIQLSLKHTKMLLLCSMSCKAIYNIFNRYDGDKMHRSRPHMSVGNNVSMPGFIEKTWIIIRRKYVSLIRSPWPIQIIIPLCASLIIGYIQGNNTSVTSVPNDYVMALACLAILSMITHVRTFSLDKILIKREIDSRANIFMFFVAYNIVDMLWLFILPVIFFVTYYNLIIPMQSLMNFIYIGIMVCWWSSGAAYVISALPLALHWASLIGVFVSIVFGAFINGINLSLKDSNNVLTNFLLMISYNRWAMETLTLNEYQWYQEQRPNDVFVVMNNIGLCGYRFDYNNKDTLIVKVIQNKAPPIQDSCHAYVVSAYAALFVCGAVFRALSLFIMWVNNNTITRRILWKCIIW